MRRDVFQAIADPIRRDIIALLAQEVLSVNAIADHFDISRPAVSKHLKILNECGVVSFSQQGRVRYCMIQPSALIPASLWLDRYKQLWEDRLDSFQDYVHELKNKQQNNE